MFDDALKRILAEVEGARCVLIAGLDGMVVAAAVSERGPAPDLVAASMADLYRKAGTALADAGLGAPGELTLGGPEGHVILREVTSEYLLAITLAVDGSLGRSRFELRKAAAALEPQFV